MDDLVICKYCEAKYQPGIWYKGFYEGTSGIFHAILKLKETQCPICNKEQENPLISD